MFDAEKAQSEFKKGNIDDKKDNQDTSKEKVMYTETLHQMLDGQGINHWVVLKVFPAKQVVLALCHSLILPDFPQLSYILCYIRGRTLDFVTGRT